MRDLGPLGHCLVEEEGAALRSTQRRRVSLLISVILQAAVLGALLLIPLLVNGERIQATMLAPGLPPCGRDVTTEPVRQQSNTGGRRHPGPDRDRIRFTEPTEIPKGIPQLNDEEGRGVPDIGRVGPGNRDGANIFGSLPSDGRPYVPPPPPDPAPSSKGKIKVSEGVQAARLIHRVMPVYPYIAKHAGVQGEVKLRAVIGRDGKVSEVVLLSGPPLLERAAREAVQQWRYQPTLLNGQPVEVETQITVVFILNR
jgi:protein TonB